jgi:hypothetical protein
MSDSGHSVMIWQMSWLWIGNQKYLSSLIWLINFRNFLFHNKFDITYRHSPSSFLFSLHSDLFTFKHLSIVHWTFWFSIELRLSLVMGRFENIMIWGGGENGRFYDVTKFIPLDVEAVYDRVFHRSVASRNLTLKIDHWSRHIARVSSSTREKPSSKFTFRRTGKCPRPPMTLAPQPRMTLPEQASHMTQ